MMQRFQQQCRALGSQAILTLVLPDEGAADELFAELWQQIDMFEARFSRFKADSELSSVNARAGEKTVISPQFHALVTKAVAMQRLTGGMFSPLLLPALQRAGYVGSWPQTETFMKELDLRDRNGQVTEQKLEVGVDWVKITADSAFDFGGIGKGYLLDQCGAYLLKKGIADFWLSLGGDILCAGFDVDQQQWIVGIQDVHTGNTVVDSIHNPDGNVLAIATSGITKRSGTYNNTQWHHIIDPKTGTSAKTDILTATITASHATEADVLAKSLVLVGTRGAEQFCSQHKIRGYVQSATDDYHKYGRPLKGETV